MINAPTLSDIAKRFRQAAAAGKLSDVKKLLEKNKRLVNHEGPTSGRTALHFAAENGHQAVVEHLLKNNASLDKEDFELNTPLMVALINKQFDLAIYLIAQNCRLDTCNMKGMNPLQLALSLPEEQAKEIVDLIRNKIAQNTALHISKQGDLQSINIADIRQTLMTRFSEQNILQLPVIIISMGDNKEDLYALIEQQLPALHQLGYRFILREYTTESHFVDEHALNDDFAQKHFKQIEIGFSENQRHQALYQQKNAKFIARQLVASARENQGGAILLLNSGAVDVKEVINKLPHEIANQCLCYSSELSDPVESLRQQLSQLSLCASQEKSVKQILVNPNPPQSTDALDLIKARLKRVSEAFEIVVDSNKLVCGLFPFNEHNPFDAKTYQQLRARTQKKIGITPLLAWTTTVQAQKPALSLFVPDLSKAKPQASAYFPQSSSDNFQFENVIKYWLTLERGAPIPELKEFPSVERYSLKFPPGKELIIEEGAIVKLELLRLQKTLDIGADHCSRTKLLRAYLKIHFKNKSTIICPMIFNLSTRDMLNIECLKDTVEMLVVRGAIVDQSLADQEIRRIYKWKTGIYTNQYDKAVTDYYQRVHDYIAQLLLGKLSSINDDVTLFSFGCGAGNELFTVAKRLRENKHNVTSAIGIDINEENYAKNLNNKDGIQFMQGDLLKLHNLLAKAKYDRNSLKIGLFLGVLVAGCMRGSYHALQVLQQARNLDGIIICGMTVVILNKDTLKAAGFEVEQQQTNAKLEPLKEMMVINADNKIVDAKHLYYLKPMSSQMREQYLIKRGTKRSSANTFDCLDLSFSANPLRDIMLFDLDSLAQIKQVDISWSYFLDEDIEPFFEKLSQLKMPSLNVLVSEHQLGYGKVLQTLKKYSTMHLILRQDSMNEYEIPAYPPKEGKALGIYQNLPIKRMNFKK